MESEQTAVESGVETTTPTESAPVESTEVEQTATEPQIEEKPVSNAVPYERFKEVNDKLRQLEEQVTPLIQANQAPVYPEMDMSNSTGFDPDTAQALDSWYAQRREEERVKEFAQKHAKDLEDTLVRGAVKEKIAEANRRGQYVNHEEALQQVKAEIEARLKPAVEQAKTESFEEGKDLALTQQKYGAVGDSKVNPKIDPSKLPAEEFAKYHGLQRVE